MIKTRLVGLLSHAKKYIVYTILWQWAALLSQVLAVFTIADLLERVVYRAVTVPVIERTILILVLVVIIRFVCERPPPPKGSTRRTGSTPTKRYVPVTVSSSIRKPSKTVPGEHSVARFSGRCTKIKLSGQNSRNDAPPRR